MAHKQDCQQIQDQLESVQEAAAGAWEVESLDPVIQRHVAGCAECHEYAEVRHWSHQVLQAGEVTVAPPLMSAVWASIHRASEQAWDSALSRSFRYLLPYMVAVVALILLVGGLTSTPTAAPVQAASTAYSVLNSPEVPAVAGVMASVDVPSQSAAQILGDSRP
jgi:hypothetical protein